MSDSPGEITTLLHRWEQGSPDALDELTPLVYAELRKIAAAYSRRQRQDHTLQPTALVNEAYLRLVGRNAGEFKNRTHFFALAARMMRQILVDAARKENAGKRGSGMKVQLDEEIAPPATSKESDVLIIHQALEKLQAHNPRIAQAIELRFFGGLELKEVAEAAGVSLATAKRDLQLGESFLRRALSAAPNAG